MKEYTIIQHSTCVLIYLLASVSQVCVSFCLTSDQRSACYFQTHEAISKSVRYFVYTNLPGFL